MLHVTQIVNRQGWGSNPGDLVPGPGSEAPHCTAPLELSESELMIVLKKKKKAIFSFISIISKYFYYFSTFPLYYNSSVNKGYQYRLCVCVCARAKLLQSCLTLHNPLYCNPPGSSVHGILQARIQEWVAVPSCSRPS